MQHRIILPKGSRFTVSFNEDGDLVLEIEHEAQDSTNPTIVPNPPTVLPYPVFIPTIFPTPPTVLPYPVTATSGTNDSSWIHKITLTSS